MNARPETSHPISETTYVVGIVHHRSPQDLERCLASVAGQHCPPRSVLVLDVEPEPGSADAMRARWPEVEWREIANRGYAGGANAVVEWSRSQSAEYVLVLNADIVLEPAFAAELAAHLDAREDVALAGGKLLRADRLHIDSAGIVLPRHRRPRDRGSEELDHGQYEQVQRVFGASGAALWIRSVALEELAIDGEVFDEDFYLYHEDTDLAWRAHRLGWSVLYVPAARAVHARGWKRDDRFRIPASVRRHSFKNHYLQMIKNERAWEFVRDLPVILCWEVLRLGFALLRDRPMLGAYRDAWRLAPAALRKRRLLGARAPGRAPIAAPPVPESEAM